MATTSKVNDAIVNVTPARSITQPAPSSSHILTQPLPTFSQLPSSIVTARVQQVKESQTDRMEKSSKLDQFLKIVNLSCPVHFMTSGKLVTHEGPFRSFHPTFPFEDYLAFKKKFIFERYTYCYYCGSPQDHKGRSEAPSCHRNAGFRGKPCPWADFPQVVVFMIWHDAGGVRSEMMENFKLEGATSYDKFMAWCKKEDSHAGEFTKLLEVFLWYCEKYLA